MSSTTQSTTMPSSNAFKYIKTSEWDVNANRYMQPRVSDRGLKMVSIISNQRNKKLHIQIPSTKCWGIEDYIDPQTQESDGKYKLKMHFTPNGSDESNDALQKLKAFEKKVIDDAVSNSEAWLGKKLGRELVEDRYTSFLKVGRNKETKEPDESRGYYFSPKVNCYDGKWDLEVFNRESKEMVFPTEEEDKSPVDFVAKGSDVICGIECKYIWIGAKGWGITWALKQCAVKPNEMGESYGGLQLDLGQDPGSSSTVSTKPVVEDTTTTNDAVEETEAVEEIPNPIAEQPKNESYMEDSDQEEEQEHVQPEPEPEPEAEAEAEAEPEVKKVKKSVVKKTVTQQAEAPVTAPKVVKKVVRKPKA